MDGDSPYNRRPVISHQLVLLRAVALLHEWGYESVRALPYMSPTGMYWRVAVRSLDDADTPGAANIHEQFDESGHTFHYTSGGCQYFSADMNRDIALGRANPEQVARAIMEVLPAANPRPGADPGYVDWFAQLAATADTLETVPFAFDDSWVASPGWQFINHPYLRFAEPPRVPDSLVREIASDPAPFVESERIAEAVSMNGKKSQRDEHYVISLCESVLGPGERQKTFGWLLGDPSLTTGRSRRLPLDGYWGGQQLVVEFQEKQHFEPVAFWDQKITASGMTRGEQRKIYDRRKVEQTVEHGIRLVHIRQDAFPMSRGKIDRDPERDLDIVRRLLLRALDPDCPAAPERG